MLPQSEVQKANWVEVRNYAINDTFSCFVLKGNAQTYFVFEKGLLENKSTGEVQKKTVFSVLHYWHDAIPSTPAEQSQLFTTAK